MNLHPQLPHPADCRAYVEKYVANQDPAWGFHYKVTHVFVDVREPRPEIQCEDFIVKSLRELMSYPPDEMGMLIVKIRQHHRLKVK